MVLFISCSWHVLTSEIEAFGELNLGKEYFEGDMILTKEQRNSVDNYRQDGNHGNLHSRDFDPHPGFRQLWPNNTVPYTIEPKMRKMS